MLLHTRRFHPVRRQLKLQPVAVTPPSCLGPTPLAPAARHRRRRSLEHSRVQNIPGPEPFAHPLLLPHLSLPLSLIPTCPGGPDKRDCPVPARMSSSTATRSLEQDVWWPLVSQAQEPGEVEAVLAPVEHRAQLCQTNQLTPNRPPVSLTQLNLELLLFISFYKGIFNTVTSPHPSVRTLNRQQHLKHHLRDFLGPEYRARTPGLGVTPASLACVFQMRGLR